MTKKKTICICKCHNPRDPEFSANGHCSFCKNGRFKKEVEK